ncbi:FkbM family methyltransferase [Burkholderiales bacterium]|nr:FkbM family methyltransferase [Burkholderiales bacterium]
MAYEGGLLRRAENLAKSYFLTEIAFSKEDIFLDCGANVGDVKLWFNLKGIKIEYQAFEPSPVEFSCLKENVSPSKTYNIGLWNKLGELKFYVSSEGADSSLIEPPTYDEIINVKVRRLEDFVNTKVKCLKLEAEGAEPEILEGLGDKIKLIEYIAADLGFERGIKAESTFIPVNNILIKNDFELVKINHRSVRALYRNKSFQKI